MRGYIQSVESYYQGVARQAPRPFTLPPITVEQFPWDMAHSISDRMVEFVTPANHEGYGTSGSVLARWSRPIEGISTVSPPSAGMAGAGLYEVFVRLPARDDVLAGAIIRLEEDCLQSEGGC